MKASVHDIYCLQEEENKNAPFTDNLDELLDEHQKTVQCCFIAYETIMLIACFGIVVILGQLLA